MDVTTLMRMPIASRTTFLENCAHKTGLQTAPGPRTEVEVLEPLVRMLLDKPVENPELLPRMLWAHYFKAPMLLMKLLRQFHPGLLDIDRPLRLLMLGSAPNDVLDEGRWFSLAWILSGLKHPPAIIAVGPGMDQPQEPSPYRHIVEVLPPSAEEFAGTLEDLAIQGGTCIDWDSSFDVVVMFHPGFFAHYEDWCEDHAFKDLATFSNVPIVGTSYDAADFEFDKHGLGAVARIVESGYWNSSAHVPPNAGDADYSDRFGTRLQWGGVLWAAHIDPDFKTETVTPSQASNMEWFQTWTNTMLSVGTRYGERMHWYYSCPMQFDALHEHLVITDWMRIHCRTGEVQVFDHRLPPGPVALELLATRSLTARLARLPSVMDEVWDQLQARGLALEA